MLTSHTCCLKDAFVQDQGQWVYSKLIFLPRLKKGRSEDQVLSTQYLLTPSLDQYQIWCRGCAQYVNDPYRFSGHMFKGQSQTILLSQVCCLAYLLWTGFASTEKINLNFAPWGAYMFLKHFLFLYILKLAVVYIYNQSPSIFH